MRFRRQTVADGAFPAALRHIAARLAAAEITPGLLRPFEAFGALAVHTLFGAVLAIATIHPFAAVRPVTPVEAVRAILTVAPVIAAAFVLESGLLRQ